MIRLMTFLVTSHRETCRIVPCRLCCAGLRGQQLREFGGEKGQALLGYLQHRAQVESAHLEELASTAFSRMAAYAPAPTAGDQNWLSDVKSAALRRAAPNDSHSASIRFSDEMILDR